MAKTQVLKSNTDTQKTDDGKTIFADSSELEDVTGNFDEREKLETLKTIIEWDQILGSCFICPYHFTVNFRFTISSLLVQADFALAVGQDVLDVIRSFCNEQRIPSHIQNRFTLKFYQYLRNVFPGQRVGNSEFRALGRVDEELRKSPLVNGWLEAVKIEKKRSEKENHDRMLIHLFTELRDESEEFRNKLQRLNDKAEKEMEAVIARVEAKKKNVSEIHLTEMKFMLSQKESIVSDGGDFEKDVRALGLLQLDGWERLEVEAAQSINDLNQKNKNEFAEVLNAQLPLRSKDRTDIETEKETKTKFDANVYRASLGDIDSVQDQNLAENVRVIENGLKACMEFHQNNEGLIVSKNTGSSSAFRSTTEAMSSAISLGKIVVGPWVGLLPNSLNLIGFGQERDTDADNFHDTCVTETASTFIDIFLGSQMKIPYRLHVQVHLNGLLFGLKSDRPRTYLPTAKTVGKSRPPLTGVILPMSENGDIDPEFLRLSRIKPEFIFDDIDTQLEQIQESKQNARAKSTTNEPSTLRSDNISPDDDDSLGVSVSITKHSNLGLGINCVLHVSRFSLNRENIKGIKAGLRAANALGLSKVFIPMRDWILSPDELREEANGVNDMNGVRNSAERKPLDKPGVLLLFRTVKATLVELSYDSPCNLSHVVFVVRSKVPVAHSDACMKYLKRLSRKDRTDGTTELNTNKYQMVSADIKVVEECISRDERSAKKAEVYLKNVFEANR